MDLYTSWCPHTPTLGWEYLRSRYHLYVASSFSPNTTAIFYVSLVAERKGQLLPTMQLSAFVARFHAESSHLWRHAVRNISQINTDLNPGTARNSCMGRTYGRPYRPYVRLVRTGLKKYNWQCKDPWSYAWLHPLCTVSCCKKSRSVCGR